MAPAAPPNRSGLGRGRASSTSTPSAPALPRTCGPVPRPARPRAPHAAPPLEPQAAPVQPPLSMVGTLTGPWSLGALVIGGLRHLDLDRAHEERGRSGQHNHPDDPRASASAHLGQELARRARPGAARCTRSGAPCHRSRRPGARARPAALRHVGVQVRVVGGRRHQIASRVTLGAGAEPLKSAPEDRARALGLAILRERARSRHAARKRTYGPRTTTPVWDDYAPAPENQRSWSKTPRGRGALGSRRPEGQAV